MSDDPLKPKPATQPAPDAKTEARAIEAAAIRRRWITLGEVLSVAAVMISALTLWNSWSERSDSQTSRAQEAQQASTRAGTLALTATASGDRELSLKPGSADQLVQSQTISFPSSLGADPAETTGEPRIEAGWFDGALKKARNESGLPDDSRGDERLPVAITTRFLVNGTAYEDVAIYDIGYTISGRLLAGHSVTLRGLSLVSRVKSGDAQKRLDARWTQIFPKK